MTSLRLILFLVVGAIIWFIGALVFPSFVTSALSLVLVEPSDQSKAYGELYLSMQVGFAGMVLFGLALWRVWLPTVPVAFLAWLIAEQFWPDHVSHEPFYWATLVGLIVWWGIIVWFTRYIARPWIFRPTTNS